MKKFIIKLALVALTMVAPASANAQSFLDGLKSVVTSMTGSEETTNALANIAGNILGTSKVKESSLIGTWKYSQPSIVFESDDVLGQLGGSVASSKVQSKLKTGLEKAGLQKGKMTITFNKDKTFSIKVGSKTQQGTYAVKDNNLTLTFKYSGRSITMNVKQSLGQLQIAMKADKMLQLVTAVATKASAYSNQMSLVSALLGKYKGMYLGMEFTK